MNFLIYIPQIVSIYLIIISLIAGRTYLIKSINNYVRGHEDLEQYNNTIAYIALTWSAKLSFFNSMFTAIFSLISIWYVTRDITWSLAALIIILLIFAYMMWFIFSSDAEELEAMSIDKLGITKSTLCSFILILINVFIIAVIAICK